MRNLVLFVNMTHAGVGSFSQSLTSFFQRVSLSQSYVLTSTSLKLFVYNQVGLACKAGLNLVKPSNNKMARERDVCAANLSITMLFVPTETF